MCRVWQVAGRPRDLRIGKTEPVPIETVPRRWTIVTWLVAGVGDAETIVREIEPHEADAIALQSVAERTVDEIAAALGLAHAWDLSHYRRSRLLPGSAVGLAVLTPHRLGATERTVSNEHRSTWSTKRRIAQRANVERADHSAYRIVHVVGPSSTNWPDDAMPTITVRPEQVGIDPERAVEPPTGATLVEHTTLRPVAGAAPMLAATWEMPWVVGDFPVG